MVLPRMEVPLSTYQKLSILRKVPTLKKLTMVVNDNKLNKAKADCIYKALSGSSITFVSLINVASQIDCDEKEHSRFNENMKPIK